VFGIGFGGIWASVTYQQRKGGYWGKKKASS
jgi:hypothetical protein